MELRPLVNDLFDLNVIAVDHPDTFAWEGGSKLGDSCSYHALCFTKKDYQHHKQQTK